MFIQNHYHLFVWLAYIIFAFLTLMVKLISCIRYEKTQGIGAGKALADWFFSPSLDNKVSWVTTLALVWVVGSIYIYRWTGIMPDWAEGIPVKIPIAAFLGTLAEWAAPTIIKAIVNKVVSLFGGSTSKQDGEV